MPTSAPIPQQLKTAYVQRYHKRPPIGSTVTMVPRASSIGNCMRQQWYRLMGYPEGPPDGGFLWVADEGTLTEDSIYGVLQDLGYSLGWTRNQDQMELRWLDANGEVIMTGHPDNVIQGNDLPGSCLLELKRCNTMRYLDLVENGINSNYGYRLQVHSYASYLNLPNILVIYRAQDVSSVRGQLTQRNRSSKREPLHVDPMFHMELVECDPDAAAEALERATTLRSSLVAARCPVREKNVDRDWQCRTEYCPFRDPCIAQGE